MLTLVNALGEFGGSIAQQSPTSIQVLGARRFVGVKGSPDQRLAQLMSAQHGCVSRRQLLSAGLTHDMIKTRIKRGQLEPIHRGVYGAAGVSDQPLRLEAAALLAGGPAALLGLMTAARIWRLLPPSHDLSPIDLVLGVGARGGARTGINLCRTTTLARKDVRVLQHLPVTSPERTLLDIAKLDHLGDRQLEEAVDEALGLGLTNLTKLTKAIANSGNQPGVPRLKGLLDRRQGSTITKLGLEARFLALIRSAGLPDPQTQAPVAGFKVDAYWPEARYVIELDSYTWHSLRRNFNRDRRKDRKLQGLGLQVTRITWEQIRDEPLEVVADVAGTIARRSGRR